ncbi:glycine zipper 2TM domain-containing protein [Simplicispira hankyongi]|uniref:Glycine zipper 2TM domain-containing protein n=1 Tax=Simplicispira hankyongi TaxID=2315688 RepID=A0A398CDL3_9BURK|nr:glycine zipper 2TM domain-containing protein [Simplicispira hankyongi]RID96933.1 glycine zipper 2TM domain-containing protein [Simplicispira hankyongi]
MKKILLFSLIASASAMAVAQERGRVLSVTPIIEQVAVPRQVCGNETVYTGPQTSGGGAVLGAIAGGAAGNAIGGGSGRAAATAIGVIGGALLGNQIEGNGRPEYQNVQRCGTQMSYENRTAGYDVVYEYAGKRYTTRTQTDPGRYIALSVQPQQQGYDQPYDDNGYSERGVVVSPYATAPMPPQPVVTPGVTIIDYGYESPRPYYPYPPPRHHWR